MLREVCACQEHRPKKQKRNQTEEDEVDMTGDIVLKVLKISGSRCAHSNSARPGPHRELTVDRIPRRCRFSLIPSTLGDRSNPPPDSDDSDDDLEYDIYGWFNFETDAEGVQRLDRKWVPLAAAAAAEDFSDALDAYEARLEAKKKDFE